MRIHLAFLTATPGNHTLFKRLKMSAKERRAEEFCPLHSFAFSPLRCAWFTGLSHPNSATAIHGEYSVPPKDGDEIGKLEIMKRIEH